MFIQTNQPLITSFYIKKGTFFAKLAMSQRLCAIFCVTGARGLKYGEKSALDSGLLRIFFLINIISKLDELPIFPKLCEK